ncbi:hypothetical protein BN59_02757 [Legionella massiliensis]|uniref:Uncharacterized protein n=1 Tax=Legionella massiliensis TaxID=1034943 RepID=A0A078KZP4_9GAMM|nr:hypothetical protein [Legionella massiliensis]CDZ78447.1 hypothetical protein BN59_02757 [Legionella massiliensis]CEE14185.1 hypothetical protein BN1094_02757 [Legionella massiliensis]
MLDSDDRVNKPNTWQHKKNKAENELLNQNLSLIELDGEIERQELMAKKEGLLKLISVYEKDLDAHKELSQRRDKWHDITPFEKRLQSLQSELESLDKELAEVKETTQQKMDSLRENFQVKPDRIISFSDSSRPMHAVIDKNYQQASNAHNQSLSNGRSQTSQNTSINCLSSYEEAANKNNSVQGANTSSPSNQQANSLQARR